MISLLKVCFIGTKSAVPCQPRPAEVISQMSAVHRHINPPERMSGCMAPNGRLWGLNVESNCDGKIDTRSSKSLQYICSPLIWVRRSLANFPLWGCLLSDQYAVLGICRRAATPITTQTTQSACEVPAQLLTDSNNSSRFRPQDLAPKSKLKGRYY